MKLLYIANQRFPTEKAYGIQIAKTCEAFADSGVLVTLLAPFRKNKSKEMPFEYYNVKENFKFKKVWAPDFYFSGRLDKIAFVIKSFISAIVLAIYALFPKPEIVYSRDESVLFFSPFFKKPRNLIFEAHRFSDSRRFFYRRFKKKNLKIVTISHGLENKFVEFGFKPENILVAPDGVDIEEFDIGETKEECRRQLNLPQDEKIVLYAGHLFDWKGAHVLAEAAAYLPEAWFVFVGGTEIDVLKFKERFGNKENIKILGQKPHREIPLFLKAADVLVLPNSAKEAISVSYTSPLKLFEYMASRRPIIASDLPSLREILNENNATLVKSDDPEALASGIKIALGNNQLAEKISQKALEDVKNYTWQKRAESILKFIG